MALDKGGQEIDASLSQESNRVNPINGMSFYKSGIEDGQIYEIRERSSVWSSLTEPFTRVRKHKIAPKNKGKETEKIDLTSSIKRLYATDDIPLKKFKTATDLKLEKTILCSLEIIGQINRKFIATGNYSFYTDTKRTVIIFDQHAVHERILLETLLNEYTSKDGKFPACFFKKPIKIRVNEEKLSIIQMNLYYFERLGLKITVSGSSLELLSLPVCVTRNYNEDKNRDTLSRIAIKSLESSFENLGKGEKLDTMHTIPKYFYAALCREACSRAIKFGKTLTKHEMELLIQKLSQCMFPFQCAHGRPTVTLCTSFFKTKKETSIAWSNIKSKS